MDREIVIEMCEKYKRVFIALPNKGFSGEAKKFGNTSMVLIDKFGNDVPISYNSIVYIDQERKKEKKIENTGERKNGERERKIQNS